jgi:CheY-like chemotaxis protein
MIDTNQIPKPSSAGANGSEGSVPARKRILLVEGDGFTRLVLLFRLRLEGFQVDFASNGILALGKLRTRHPDALLVELKLNGLSGLELIKAARADPVFGNRPIYVFTYTERMSRSTRKEVTLLATAVLDKASTSREHMVQTFTSLFARPKSAGAPPKPGAAPAAEADLLNEMVPSGALEEIIAGVREQSKTFAASSETGGHVAACRELLSRVCSLASCAEAAGLANLARQSKALENFLHQLCAENRAPTESALSTEVRAVEVLSQLSPEVAGNNQSLSRFTAVVMDEAPSSNRALQKALREAGFDAICFDDPTRVQDHLASNQADLIIANVILPEAHGLALNDIRQLPQHAETPIIFVTDSSPRERSRDELPTSAPRLDSNPLLIKELIMKALNEVQSKHSPPPAIGAPVQPRPVRDSKAAAIQKSQAMPSMEDGFELFATPQRPAEGFDSPAPAEPALSEGSESEVAEPVFASAAVPPDSIPSQPIQWAIPGEAGAEGHAEVFSRLPANAADALLTDDQRIEMVQPSGFQLEPAEPPKPEATSQDQAAMDRLALAQSDSGGFAEAMDHDPQPESNEASQAQEFVAGAQDLAQDVGNELFSPQSEHAADGTPAQQSDAMETYPHQDGLATQFGQEELVPNAEVESHSVEAQQVSDEPCVRLIQSAPESPSRERERGAQISELEQQVRQSVAELAQATAELAHERGERQRSERRIAALNARLQELHADLGQTLESHTASLGRIGSLENELRQTSQALARTTAEVEQQQAERQLAEEQLQQAKELNAGLRKNLAFFEANNQNFDQARQDLQARLEASLSAARESEAKLQRERAERQRLAETLEGVQHQLQSPHRESLERELQTTLDSLHETEAKLRQETAERQRLSQALESAQLELQDRSHRSDLEFSKLQSALQVEQAGRRSQETQLTRLHHGSVDAVRAARSLRSSLRRQIREPVDGLYNSARSLLELELGDEQKRLAQAVLQDALLLHTKLREPELPQSDSTDTEPSSANPTI